MIFQRRLFMILLLWGVAFQAIAHKPSKETRLISATDSAGQMLKHGMYDEIIEYLEKQQPLITAFKKPNNQVSDYYRVLAKAYSCRLNFDLAFMNFINADNYCDTSRGKTQLIRNLLELGEYYRKIADYKSAKEKLASAMRYELKAPVANPYNRAKYYNRLAAIYTETGLKDSSLFFSKACVLVAEKYRFYDLLTLSYNEMAYNTPQIDASEAYYNKALEAAILAGNDMDWASIAINKSRMLGRCKKYDEEKKLLEACFVKANKNNWLVVLEGYYFHMANIAGHESKPLEQAVFNGNFYKTRLKIAEKHNRNKVSEIQKIYDQEKNLDIIKKQKQEIGLEKEISEQKRKEQFWVIIISGILFILLIVIAFFAFKFSRVTKGLTLEKQKLNSANTELQGALDQNELLVREIHHRVKNNLQIISSILDIQQRKENNPAVSGAFKDARTRISSMALVHQNLYEKENPVELDTHDYFDRLFRLISASYRNKSVDVTYEVVINNIQLNIDSLIPLALIVNEWLTNSYKYAFSGRTTGTIRFELFKTEEGYKCVYKDDGIGLENDVPLKQGLGTLMIEQLSKQLFGKMEKISSDLGLEYIFIFKGL